MYLNWRCDTGMHWIQSEAYSKHTNGIQEFQRISMQACSGHDSYCLIFIATSTAQWQLVNNGISKLVSPPSLPHYTRGITACRCHPPLVNHVEKPTTVSLSVVFMFLSPIPNVFSPPTFQLNYFSVAGIDGPLSVHKANDSWSRHPALANLTKKPATVSLSVVFISPRSQCFLTVAFFN